MTQSAHMISFQSGTRQHEVLGLNENMKEIACRFASVGYVALAVDLVAGRNPTVCMARFMAGQFLNPLNNSAIHALKAALTFLSEQPGVDDSRLGAVGYCMGGSFVIAWTCTDDRLQVIAPYYATNPRPLKAVARLSPVVGSYPGNDFMARSGRKLDLELDRYHVPHDIKIYPGTKHAFFNDTFTDTYNEAAAQDSWERVLAFFGERLEAKEA
jgi:carboxymethylenebutenolidase